MIGIKSEVLAITQNQIIKHFQKLRGKIHISIWSSLGALAEKSKNGFCEKFLRAAFT